MNCDPLPRTGPDDLGLILIIALACLVVGAAFVVLARRRRRAPATLAAVLLVGAALLLGPGAATPAQAVDCVTVEGSPSTDDAPGADNSLTVVQTSTMAGLAPGIAPVPITGRVVNNGPDSTHIDVVTVEITSVSTAPGTPAADCDASDYVLLDTTMAVDRTLGPDGGSAAFSGASIGFANKPVNQDACQRATVHLLYTANPVTRQ
jgi:LPXTG-motif cell wall-anchored protein